LLEPRSIQLERAIAKDVFKTMFQIAYWRVLVADFGCTRANDASMSKPISKPEALQQRLISHAAVLLNLSANLPHTPQATHVSRQLLRSGTAAAANYGEARSAESRSDFIHKLRIVLKELNETTVWLQLIIESSLVSREKMSPIVAENAELCRIIAASIRTAGGFERD
jgi:four helix bundle protein